MNPATQALSRFREVTLRRDTVTLPDDGSSSPAATFNSVDLPQPVGPTTETNSPGATTSVVSRIAV